MISRDRDEGDESAVTTGLLSLNDDIVEVSGTTVDTEKPDEDLVPAQHHITSTNNNVSITASQSSKLRFAAGSGSAQVAPLPLPRTEDFHVGKILGSNHLTDAAQPPAVLHEEEASYIPVALAREHLAKVVADMHAMKDEQALKIASIMERYKAIEVDTQAHYESYVKELKSKAKRKIEDEKRKFAALESASAEQQAQASAEKASLLVQHEQEKLLHEQQRQQWRESLESSLQQHEDAMAHCHLLVENELIRVSQVHDLDTDTKLEHLRNELVMCWEDAKSESGRMVMQLDQLRKELLVKEKAFLRRVQQMQAAFDTELETLQCLNTVVNRVVDMAQQQSQRRKTQELTHQISRLESEMKEAAHRESSLQQRLQQARERFEGIERAAVVDAMEFLIQTLEVRPVTPPKPVIQAPAIAAEMMTTSIQTDEEEKQQDLALTTLPLSQVQYESQVERLRERNLEILHSKARLKAQKAELQSLLKKKNAAKAQIKSWLASFQQEHGREPVIEDKAQVKDLYLLFKVSEEAYNSKKDEVALLKARHHERVLEIDTITQWQALRDTMVKSSVCTEFTGEFAGFLLESTSRGSSASSSGSRPVSSSLSTRRAETEEIVLDRGSEALEHELALLRQELAAVKQANAVEKGDHNDDDSSEAKDETVESGPEGVSPEEPEADMQFGEVESGDFMDAPVRAEDAAQAQEDSQAQVSEVLPKSQSQEALERQEDELRRSMLLAHEQEQQQGLVATATETEQQRTSLQTTIAQLALEIDQRKDEKSKLEKEIEQLRLHLELMELNHDHDHNIDMDNDEYQQRQSIHYHGDFESDEKPSARGREEQTKRRASQNTFFDDEEEVESDGEDGSEERVPEQGAKSPARVPDDEELPGTTEDSEDSEDSDEEDESLDQESAADAKDSSYNMPQMEKQEEEEKDPESPDEKDDFMTILHLISIIRDSVEQGKAQFNKGDKAKCYQTYLKSSEKCVEELRNMHQSRREDVAAFKSALSEAARLPAARGSMFLRKQLDLLLADCEKRLKDREERAAARRKAQLERSMAASAAKQAIAERPPTAKQSPVKQPPSVKKSHKKATPPDLGSDSVDNSNSVSPTKSSAGANSSATATPVGGKVLEEYKQKLKALEAKAKSDKVKITQLEASLAKAETQLSSGGSGGNSNSGGGANSAVLERKMGEMEKKHKHALEDAEKSLKKEIGSLSQQLQAAQSKSQALQDQVLQSQKELSLLGGKATQLSKLEDEMVTLKQQAAQAATFSEELTTTKAQLGKLETSYKEEQSLRKKYYNMIEDMKGKIRVYARCRPMSSSELERGCLSCVKFVDEYSLELETSRGPKPFAFDQVFSPASSQDQVFEDTKNLLQSAIDGYNVCIFAYGQTGSGKTFTMTGTETMPGLSPRAIHHLFQIAEDAKSNHTITFQAFMLELYNDNLIDLFHLVDVGHDREAALAGAQKLEIKKNDKGMVFVSNSTMKPCTSAQQTLKLFEAANKKRQVGSTKMNAESSRSHSVFSILVENYNKTTKATSIGKLSLVDLAGSERAGKTGATAERLKEAQAINKSLSGALRNGDCVWLVMMMMVMGL